MVFEGISQPIAHARPLATSPTDTSTDVRTPKTCQECFVLYLPIIDSMSRSMIENHTFQPDQAILSFPWFKIPQFGYRMHQWMFMLGIGYQGLHRDDSLTGQVAEGIVSWSIGLRYYFYQTQLWKRSFSAFIAGNLYWNHLLENQEELSTQNSEKEFEDSAQSYELSLGAQHALNPHFHLGASVGFSGYTYTRVRLKDQGRYTHTWYQSIMKLFIQIEFF